MRPRISLLAALVAVSATLVGASSALAAHHLTFYDENGELRPGQSLEFPGAVSFSNGVKFYASCPDGPAPGVLDSNREVDGDELTVESLGVEPFEGVANCSSSKYGAVAITVRGLPWQIGFFKALHERIGQSGGGGVTITFVELPDKLTCQFGIGELVGQGSIGQYLNQPLTINTVAKLAVSGSPCEPAPKQILKQLKMSWQTAPTAGGLPIYGAYAEAR